MAISTTVFAPSIRAVQPAFVYTTTVDENNIVTAVSGTCTVYFTLNYNQISDVADISYTLIDPNKSALNGLNSMIKQQKTPSYTLDANKTEQSFKIEFNITDFKLLTVNQFYQIQIELQDNNGNWSAPSQISLIRPIPAVDTAFLKVENQTLLGAISYTDNSLVETIYSYYYKIFQTSSKELVYTSKTIINLLGLSFESKIPYIFKEGVDYTIELTYYTKHDYTPATVLSINYTTNLITIINYEETNIIYNLNAGSIILKTLPTGGGMLQRADNTTNYEIWQDLGEVVLGETSFIDATIEAKLAYAYRFKSFADQQTYLLSVRLYEIEPNATSENVAELFEYNSQEKLYFKSDGIYDKRKVYYTPSGIQNVFMCDYEDIFLIDADAMLAIRYNPQISNFCWVVQEYITNTLGGEYPLVQKAGSTRYRQFSLSGTLYIDSTTSKAFMCSIAGLSDPFYEESVLYLNNAMDYNITYLANHLKDVTIQWLTNGKIKLFRSAEEGLCLVKLTNITFSPIASSGRRLYSFSATATEVCQASLENIKKYSMINSTVDASKYINVNDMLQEIL